MTLDDIAACLRALAASQARIEREQAEQREMQLEQREMQLEQHEMLLELQRAGAGDTRRPDAQHVELVAALRGYFGSGPFAAATVLVAADENPDLADALAALIDMNQPSRAVALGLLLPKVRGLEEAGERRGARLWRVRG